MLTRFRKWGVRDGSGESVSLSQGQQRDRQPFMLTITPVINTFSWDSMQSCKKLSTPLDSIATFSSKNFKEYISI